MSSIAQMAQQLAGPLPPWAPLPEALPARAHKYDVRAERRRREIVASINRAGHPVTRVQVTAEFGLSASHTKKLMREAVRDGVLARRLGTDGRTWRYWVVAA